MVEVFEPEEMGMCRSLFPFSPLLTHCSEETGSVGEPREKREERDGGGGGMFVLFAYVMVVKNVENV